MNMIRGVANCASTAAPPPLLQNLAFEILRVRKAARSYFGDSLLSEASWNLLLVLYARDGAGQGLHIGSAADRAFIPRSTALRWLVKLEQHGFVVRIPEAKDKRAVRVQMTDFGRETMRKSFIASQYITR